MNIIVCIKQVPDTSEVKIDPATNTLKREGVASIINPFDMYALETGLRLKDKHGGQVNVLTMGPPQAEEALKETVSYGADGIYLLSDRAFAGADTWATSLTLARGVAKIGAFDLIVCGKQAIDGDTAQVGPGLAEQLGIPYVCFVSRIVGLDAEAGRLTVERMMDDAREVVEITLPALITVVKEVAEVRVPSLKGKMKARKAQAVVLNAEAIGAAEGDIGLAGSPTQVVEIFPPQPRGARTLIEGEPDEQARELLARLKTLDFLNI